MLLSLSSQNVIQYLDKAGLCSLEDGTSDKAELPKSSNKNFNLLVKLPGDRQLLVKQERLHQNDGSPHEFFNEWLFHQLLQQFPVLGNMGAIASSLLYFDEQNSILVRNYLSEYLELKGFYQNQDIYPTEIAAAIGKTLAGLHRTTFQHREYQNFMATAPQGQFRYHFYNPAQGIGSISPEILAMIPTEALEFYLFCQYDEILESSIADLASEWNPCCLTHNDLTLSNILVHSRWEQLDNCLVRLIDWEACGWGDPAFDLGTLLASYLEIWLSSLVVDPTIELEESFHLAVTAIEILQPSIVALIRNYLHAFPIVLEYSRDFILRVIQFAGLTLIHQIQDLIQRCQSFHRSKLCMLQIAKSLLTMPGKAVLTIFGISESEILQPITELHELPQPEPEKQLLRIYSEKTRLRGC